MPVDGRPNITLYVSNQSYDLSPVDIRVFMDGAPVISAEFEVGNQHNFVKYQFHWSEGWHLLKAVSEKGEATVEKEIQVAGDMWGFIGFWYDADGDQKKHFTVLFQDEPIYFQ